MESDYKKVTERTLEVMEQFCTLAELMAISLFCETVLWSCKRLTLGDTGQKARE